MGFGKCDACAAKDSEIAFLREQTAAKDKLIAEMAVPFANARIGAAMRQPSERRPQGRAPMPHSASALRNRMEDRPLPPQAARQTPQEVEASFQRK